MALIGIVLLVIMVISAVLLVLVVLVQDDQGDGLGGIFGGGSNTAFGSRSGNVLTRLTAVLAGVFLFCVFGLAWINRTPTASNLLNKARQEALSANANQSWWVQAPAPGAATGPAASGSTSVPAGASAPTTPAEGTSGPATAPGTPSPASQSAPAGGG
jgi:preprotein translocase subunit SecG